MSIFLVLSSCQLGLSEETIQGQKLYEEIRYLHSFTPGKFSKGKSWLAVLDIFKSYFFVLGANGQPIDCCSNGKNPFDLTFYPDTVAVCLPIQIPRNDPFYRGKKPV